MTKINDIATEVMYCCYERNPEALDNIFDNLSRDEYQSITHKLLEAISILLKKDVDTLAWFCGYMASEINRTEDNFKPIHPITLLSEVLIRAGMQPFVDFTPYPTCRLIISNITKFESLPQEIKTVVQDIFSTMEADSQEAKQINDALLQELVVNEE